MAENQISRQTALQFLQWPPDKAEDELVRIHAEIKDWQITYGSLIKLVRTDEGHAVLSTPIGVSMFPTLFPRSCFEDAIAIQQAYNELYVKVAEDEEWLYEVLKGLIASDPLAKTLWSIHEKVKEEGYVQVLSLGVFRSDYMLHAGPEAGDTPVIKQVEFNNYSCAGGTHGNIVANMHQHLARMGCFSHDHQLVQVPDPNSKEINPSRTSFFSPDHLPKNETVQSIVNALATAHHIYADSRTDATHELAILMTVQPYNVNICDERPISHSLWSLGEPIPTFRVEFGREVLKCCSLDSSNRLLFHSPFPAGKIYEISVIYQRAGYDAKEYNGAGIAARLLLERSLAIKAPSLLAHITTFKKVQQALAVPGALERFLTAEQAIAIAATFAPLHPLDASPAGQHARTQALNPQTAVNYVLKPSLEGGGHNIYGPDIPNFLNSIDTAKWPDYIVMELIRPPELRNILLSSQGVYHGPVISELGIFGTVLWRKSGSKGGPEILQNENAGWSFKTKAAHVNEMSVIKGYGCFDCPFLVDM